MAENLEYAFRCNDAELFNKLDSDSEIEALDWDTAFRRGVEIGPTMEYDIVEYCRFNDNKQEMALWNDWINKFEDWRDGARRSIREQFR